MIIADGVYFEAFDATKVLWRSDRVSWDGITILDRSSTMVLGEVYDPMSDQWQPFELNVLNGAVQGGSYQNMRSRGKEMVGAEKQGGLWHGRLLKFFFRK